MRATAGSLAILWARKRLAAFVAAALVVVLVLAASALGLRLPGLGFLDVFGDRTELDYESRYFNDFVPLREPFVAERLGAAGSSDPLPDPTDPRQAVETRSPRLKVKHAATNDRFTDAYAISSVPFTAETSTAAATREPGEPGSCSPVGGTLWYRYTPTEDLTLLAETLGTPSATGVAVFMGSTLEDLVEVGCNVDPGRGARVGFPAKARTTYYVQISSPAPAGALVFSLEILGRTTRVSVSSSGEEANSWSYEPAISADGRYVVFHSAGDNLVPNQRPCFSPAISGCGQVFVRDLASNRTELVSATPTGTVGNADAGTASISANGRFVAFMSYSSDLVRGRSTCEDWGLLDPSSSPCPPQVFVRDLRTRVTRVASVSSSGELGNGESASPSLSSDGRYVAFDSLATNLAGEPTTCGDAGSPCQQVHVHDFETGTTEMVSVSSEGLAGDADSYDPSISGNGRFVAFGSYASNLAKPDSDANSYVLVHDRTTRRTELVSVSMSCEPGCVQSRPPFYGSSRYISHDGRYVMFGSHVVNNSANPNGVTDVFMRDRLRRTTTKVSVSASNGQANNGHVGTMSMSPDGRYLGFDSAASNLVPGDTNDTHDVFVRDMLRKKTIRMSVSSLGVQGDDISWSPALSTGARVVAFSSTASNIAETKNRRLCPSRNGIYCSDIFVHEGDPWT